MNATDAAKIMIVCTDYCCIARRDVADTWQWIASYTSYTETGEEYTFADAVYIMCFGANIFVEH